MRSYPRQIFLLIRAFSGQRLTLEELSKILMNSKSRLSDLLSFASSIGLIKKVTRGVYEFPEDPPKTVKDVLMAYKKAKSEGRVDENRFERYVKSFERALRELERKREPKRGDRA